MTSALMRNHSHVDTDAICFRCRKHAARVAREGVDCLPALGRREAGRSDSASRAGTRTPTQTCKLPSPHPRLYLTPAPQRPAQAREFHEKYQHASAVKIQAVVRRGNVRHQFAGQIDHQKRSTTPATTPAAKNGVRTRPVKKGNGQYHDAQPLPRRH